KVVLPRLVDAQLGGVLEEKDVFAKDALAVAGALKDGDAILADVGAGVQEGCPPVIDESESAADRSSQQDCPKGQVIQTPRQELSANRYQGQKRDDQGKSE